MVEEEPWYHGGSTHARGSGVRDAEVRAHSRELRGLNTYSLLGSRAYISAIDAFTFTKPETRSSSSIKVLCPSHQSNERMQRTI
jgi:hypothetical protein